MNYTPEEEYRLTGKLVGRNAEDALEALASAETERETARSIGSWAPSAGDYADELYELARLAARPALPPEVKESIEAAVNSIRDQVFDRWIKYNDWRCGRA